MAKIHWAATEKTPACNRSRTYWRTVSCPAGEYLPAEAARVGVLMCLLLILGTTPSALALA